MKKSVILDIFNGVRGHRETMNMPKYERGEKSIVSETYDILKEKLSAEVLNLHTKFVDALDSEWAEEVDFYFIEGFKLGLLIGIESME